MLNLEGGQMWIEWYKLFFYLVLLSAIIYFSYVWLQRLGKHHLALDFTWFAGHGKGHIVLDLDDRYSNYGVYVKAIKDEFATQGREVSYEGNKNS